MPDEPAGQELNDYIGMGVLWRTGAGAKLHFPELIIF
jgi:hypothetical protein